MIQNNKKNLVFIGSASGWGAKRAQTEEGPAVVQSSDFLRGTTWQKIIYPTKIAKNTGAPSDLSYPERLQLVTQTTSDLAQQTALAVQSGNFPIVIGGDHSMAIGTWSGVAGALQAKQKFGLIWFDAHMDSHTPQTTPSMAIHGMPLAVLLGHGESDLTNIYESGPKVDPRHVVLMGVRSYEEGEAALLTRLGVKIFYMDDIRARGFEAVSQEALEIVSNNTHGFGISIDLDGFDPQYAPGVGSPEPGGLSPQEVLPVLSGLLNHAQCKALEIAEFNPTLDRDNKTRELIGKIIGDIHR